MSPRGRPKAATAALGTSVSHGSAFAGVAQDDPSVEFSASDMVEAVDEVSADQWATDESTAPTGETIADIYHSLPPEKRMDFFLQTVPSEIRGTAGDGWDWVNENRFPTRKLVWRWISAELVARNTMNGYRRVKRSPETEQWVPNARQFGSSPFIVCNGYVLCVKPLEVWLREEARRVRQSNQSFEKATQFTDNFREARGILGLTTEEAEKLGRATKGVVMVRGSDPNRNHPADEPDWVDGDESA